MDNISKTLNVLYEGKSKITKEDVVKKMVAGGFNAKDATELVDAHFDYAVKHYTNMKTIIDCILAIGT